MTKGTKIFRIIICILLVLTMLWSAFLGVVLISGIRELVLTSSYDIWVAGEPVTRTNANDVLGDGTVRYNPGYNTLTFDNAKIESDHAIINSRTDLNVELIGENKFICKNKDYSIGIYAGDNYLSKDLAFVGDGSLTIELPEKSAEAVGIFAADLTITTDVTVITSDCKNKVHGIVCDSSMIVAGKGTVTVNNGAAKNSSGVRVRGNALFEEGTALNVSVRPGTPEICKGFSISGDLFLGKDTLLDVSIDDGATELGECLRVSGLMDIGIGSKVNASAKNTHAVECFGSIKANKGASISSASDKQDADIFCYGAVVNYGADIDGEIDAIGGIRNQAVN